MNQLVDDEDRADAVRDAIEVAERRVTCRLTFVEGRAALAAAFRDRRMTMRAHETAKTALREILAETTLVDLSPSLIESAGDLAERYALRGYDAVHLACALDLPSEDVGFATLDAILGHAAREAGLEVVTA